MLGFSNVREKEKELEPLFPCLRARDISHQRHYFVNPNGEDVQKWVSNLVLKFHDDPTVNKSEIVVLLGQIWMYAGKREDFGREERKMNLRERENVGTYSKCKNWHNMSLFIVRVFSAYYLFYFFYFIIL